VVFTGSSSVTYQLTPRWLIGADLAGALTRQVDLGKAQLQGLLGARYALAKAVGLDLTMTSGKFEGSHRRAPIGISIDF
jgi:hypothetical protein